MCYLYISTVLHNIVAPNLEQLHHNIILFYTRISKVDFFNTHVTPSTIHIHVSHEYKVFIFFYLLTKELEKVSAV